MRLRWTVIIALVAAFAAASGALAQQDYRSKGMSVYAPRPIPAAFGASAAAANTSSSKGAVTPSIDIAMVRTTAQRMLSDGQPRWITVRNANTGESLTAQFWHDGDYDAWEIARFSQLVSDHREHAAAAIDRRLVDLVWILARLAGRDTVTITSGYRSESTNMHLAAAQPGVASDSLHRSGRALDIAIPGVAVSVIAQRAVALAWGGVGEYRTDGHVHVDVGVFREWRQ